MNISPSIPAGPVGPSMPSKFILYIILLFIFPLMLTMLDIINWPLDFTYEYTVPSKRFNAFDLSTQTIEFPFIYDKYDSIYTVIKLLYIISITLYSWIVDVLNLSPFCPEGPIDPVGPIYPVGPVVPV